MAKRTKLEILDASEGKIIMVDEAKLMLCIKYYTESIEKQKGIKGELYGCSGIFITLTITFLTSTFHDFINVPSHVWQAIFIILLAYFFCKSIRLLYLFLFQKQILPEELVKNIKSDATQKIIIREEKDVGYTELNSGGA